MDINGMAWESAGDGGDLYIDFDFTPYKEKIEAAVKKYMEENDGEIPDTEDFLSSNFPEIVDAVEAAMQEEAENLADENGYDDWEDMDDDSADSFDCMLLVCDQYSDSEWEKIVNVSGTK